MDFISKYRQKQIAVWVLVGLTAVLANIPREWATRLNLHTESLLGVLGLLIVLALFFFARFSYFFLTVLLIIGANLPDRWSLGLEIDKTPLIFALAIMIVGSLLNQVSKVMPTGLEPRPKERNPEGIRALITAIGHGRERAVKAVVGMNIDLNAFDDQGRSPLMAAAMGGNAEIVELLLGGGAEIMLKNPNGLTAIDVAVQAGHTAIVTRLQELVAQAQPAEPATAPVSALRMEQSRL